MIDVRQQIDPITLEVLWNRLIAVVNEQATALMRTSFTTVVRESGDLSAGVFDPRGYMIAQAVTGTPGHINSMATCIHHFLAVYPADSLQPGDVLITNDPQKTSGQLHDFTVISPIFDDEGTLIAYFGSTCHAIDIGGRGLSADARSMYEEGLFVPITKWYDAGRPNEELVKIIRANVREPDQVLGDIHAQVAGNNVGGARLKEFMAEFGLTSILPLADEIITRSERAMRDAIATVPDGVYTHSGQSDGFDAPVTLAVTITKKGDAMHVDWTGSSPASPRGINVVLNYTHAYVTYALKCALCPDVPNNEGSFRPVTVTAPPGSLLNALPPAPVAGRHVIGHFLPGIVFGALAPVLPGKVIAEGAANIWATQLTGTHANGDPWTYVWFSCGGTGARPTSDGIHTTAFPSGVMGVPVEVIESVAPLLIRRREIAQDSGGAGRFRGGCGQYMEVGALTGRGYNLGPIFDRTRVPAEGYSGGGQGARGAITLSDGRELQDKSQVALVADERFTLQLPGGGGYFDPLTRDTQAVLDDVLDGFVSIAAARAQYGVAIDPATMTIDDDATATLRRDAG
ncbi:MAG: hydantoinase B/oxoprolinase family protein [Chloroflexota bacterium]|nr:hydantoinase B/oxoprolinase family protein [Chloroflexota bacterium]